MEDELFRLIIFGAIGGIILSGSVIFFVVIYQKKLATQQLHLQSQQIEHQKEIMRVELATQYKEREDIAFDLHNELISNLSSIKMTSSKLLADVFGKKMREERIIQHIHEAVEQSIIQARNISHRLASPILLSLGLSQALSSFCGKFIHSKISIVYESMEYNERVSLDLERIIYSAGQELIQNALKHSKGSLIKVKMVRNKDRLMLSVSDNGQGMGLKTAKKTDGMGLLSIEKKLQLLQGDLSIEPNSPSGLIVRISIPITNTIHTP